MIRQPENMLVLHLLYSKVNFIKLSLRSMELKISKMMIIIAKKLVSSLMFHDLTEDSGPTITIFILRFLRSL